MVKLVNRDSKLNDFLVLYNEILSRAALEHKGNFAALASPTLNKQETTTYLYRDVINYLNKRLDRIRKINPITIRLKFLALLGYSFFQLIKTSARFRVRSIPNNCIFIRSWLLYPCINNGKVKDIYFRRLVDDLSEISNVVVGFQPLEYGKILNQYSKAQKPDNYIISVGLLSILDIIKIIFNYIISGKVILKEKYIFKGVNICGLINDSLKIDYYKLRSFHTYVELSIAKKIKKYNPEIFLYNFENQSWENANLLVLSKTKTKIIGYQSSGFSSQILNFFPTKLDSEFSLFPDKILTIGDSTTELLKSLGNYPIPVNSFAALRFDYPCKDGRYKIENFNTPIHNRILYAFTAYLSQYQKIIQDLIDVFKDSEVDIHLKFHPLNMNYKIPKMMPKNFKLWSQNDSTKLNQLYDAVLFNDTSYGFESLIQGVKPFEYIVNEYYDETRMLNFHFYKNRLNKEDLFELKEKIINKEYQKYLSPELVNDYISKNFKVYNGFNDDIFS